MRKVIASNQSPLLLAGAVVLLLGLTGCTLFKPAAGDAKALNRKDVQAFADAVRIRPGDAEAHYRLGIYMQERKKHRPAIEEFKAALAIDPAHIPAHNAMGVSRDMLGDHGRAVDAYTAALRIDPQRGDVRNNLGYSYLLQGRLEQAVEHFAEALALDPANARYRNNLGLALARGGRYDDALAAFKATGDEAQAHRNIARLYFSAGRYKEAEAHWVQASRTHADPETARGLQASAALAAILTPGKRQPDRDAAKAARPAVRIHGGHRTMPPEASSSPARYTIVHPETPAAAVQSAAAARSDEMADIRAAVLEMIEGDPHAKLDNAQMSVLARLTQADRTDSVAVRTKIEVANGNGVRRMARHVGEYLRGRDVVLMYLSNAPHFNHPETIIYYTAGHLQEAYRLSGRLPGRQRLEEVSEIRGGHAEISILIGRDLIPHIGLFDRQEG